MGLVKTNENIIDYLMKVLTFFSSFCLRMYSNIAFHSSPVIAVVMPYLKINVNNAVFQLRMHTESDEQVKTCIK